MCHKKSNACALPDKQPRRCRRATRRTWAGFWIGEQVISSTYSREISSVLRGDTVSIRPASRTDLSLGVLDVHAVERLKFGLGGGFPQRFDEVEHLLRHSKGQLLHPSLVSVARLDAPPPLCGVHIQ